MAGFRSASSTTVVAGRASGPGRHAVDRWAPRSASRSVYSTPALTRKGFRRSSRRVGLRAVVDSACLALVSLALVNLVVQGGFGHWLAWVSAVVVAGGATLLALAAAEHGGLQQVQRWQLQAVAGAALMLMLMAAGVGDDALAAPALLLAGATAGALLATAAAYRSGPRWLARSLYLALDAGVLAVTTTLAAVALGSSTTAAGLIGLFVSACYAVAIVTRGAAHAHISSPDALLLGGSALLVVYTVGQAAQEAGWLGARVLGGPELTLLAAVCLARSGWTCLEPTVQSPAARPADNSRLRLAPAVAAAVAIAQISWGELTGHGTRIGFFGVVLLFALIVGRLVLTLVENRALLQRVERSGVFEEQLRDLGTAVVSTAERSSALGLVCRTAQHVLGADSVLLWMVDSDTDELEAVDVLGPRRLSLLNRRLSLADPTSLAVRVVRSGEPETVAHAATAGLSNGFLNVLLRSQSLLAVPIAHGNAVQGVLVCVDAHDETAYGPAELGKAELLAAQVAVALDNIYQHSLQRRRLEELSALYQFAQSAHAALSGTEIVQQLLPIIQHRLSYSYARVWLREGAGATLRQVAHDGPPGETIGANRPSPLAVRAFAIAEPAHAGLDWADGDGDDAETPAGAGMRSQIAVPMVLQRRVVGVVDLESRQPNAYSLNDQRLLVALANHAALAVDNLHLLEEARKVVALKEMDRLKTELLSTVSHELRTPLGSIKGFATTLLQHDRRLPREERREFLQIIDSEADRLRELIENLLDMSRLEAGVLRIDRTPVKLARVAEEATRKVQLSAPQYELSLDWPEDELVMADPRRIYQVIQNLLSNAVKYSPAGGRIELRAEFGARELEVSVRDEGLGMPRGELDRIFERFHRVGGEVSQRVGGTGLGLAICKGLVEAHGGRIWAESDGEGKGSTFRFTLPVGARAAGTHHHDEEFAKSP